MSAMPIAILKTGLVTSVGLSAPASCAAIRAKLTNPSETRFIDSSGEWIMAHQVTLEQPWRGLAKLAKMAAMVIEEALQDIPRNEWVQLPLLLCVAEKERPGRMEGLDDQLFLQIQNELGTSFAPESVIITHGRVGVAVAMAQARILMVKNEISRVLIAATDSLLSWPTLSHYEREDRLLTEKNSNGFMPGEGAGALLVGSPSGGEHELVFKGIAFARESAHILTEDPLRADGLSQAIKLALADAGAEQKYIDFRIADLAGEQYYFKEASLALSRTRPFIGEVPELWHPAESTGEMGAASGCCCMVLGTSATQKAYSPGPAALFHFANDAGQRAALIASLG
jgi:3-oxoacyl-[acyl-carrier-protein] synthase I